MTASHPSFDKIDQCRNDSDSEVTLTADQHNPCLSPEGNSLTLGLDHAQQQLAECMESRACIPGHSLRSSWSFFLTLNVLSPEASYALLRLS